MSPSWAVYFDCAMPARCCNPPADSQYTNDIARIVWANSGAKESGYHTQLAPLSWTAGADLALCWKLLLSCLSLHASTADGAQIVQTPVRLATHIAQ